MGLEKEVAAILNRESRENESDTPDFILATFMVDCLAVLEKAVRQREAWYGREIGNWAGAASPVGSGAEKEEG